MREPKSEASRRVGELVRKTREDATMSRSRLAHLAGLDVSHIARIERGLGNPTLFALIQLATALGIRASDFVAGLDASHLPANVTAMSEREYQDVIDRRHDH